MKTGTLFLILRAIGWKSPSPTNSTASTPLLISILQPRIWPGYLVCLGFVSFTIMPRFSICSLISLIFPMNWTVVNRLIFDGRDLISFLGIFTLPLYPVSINIRFIVMKVFPPDYKNLFNISVLSYCNLQELLYQHLQYP